MATLFMDGFDLYDDAADVAASSWNLSGAALYVPSEGRSGGGALKLGATTTMWSRVVPDQDFGVTRCYSFSVKFSAFPSTSATFFSTYPNNWGSSTGNFSSRLRVGSSGDLRFTDETSEYSASFSFATNTWYRVEVKIKTNNSSAGTFNGSAQVYVNGNLVYSNASLYISLSGSTDVPIDRVLFWGVASGASVWIDDFVISDDLVGDVIIDTLRPNGDGTAQDWIANTGTASSAIDDLNHSSDGDTTYVSSTNSGDKSEFSLTDLLNSSSSIISVQPRVKEKKTDIGDRSYRTYLLSNGNIGNGNTLSPGTAYSWDFNGLFDLNPDGSAAWDDAAINALQVGLESVT